MHCLQVHKSLWAQGSAGNNFTFSFFYSHFITFIVALHAVKCSGCLGPVLVSIKLLNMSVMTCVNGSESRMQQNPTGDDWVNSMHECGSGVKVAGSTTMLAHRFPPPLSSEH